MARMNKLQEKEADLNDPTKRKKGPSMKSALTDLQRLQKQQEKERLAFIKQLMEDKNAALAIYVSDYERIKNLLPVTTRAQEQYADYNDVADTSYAQAVMYRAEIKAWVRDADADNVHDAETSWHEFEAAVMTYTLSCIENEVEFEDNEIIALWDNMMSAEHIAVLNRGTTPFNSIDYIFNKIETENGFKTPEDVQLFKDMVAKLLVRYNIRETEAPSEDI
jgi:hypothetical protein